MPEPTDSAASTRLVSLDALRGFTIAAMLMVNNTVHDQAYPSWFRHATWGEGVTFCDLIFPWFLFCVGVAIPFSYAAFRAKGKTHRAYLRKALRRAGALVLLGIVLVSSIARELVIGLDVLQLIGLAFLVGALAYRFPPIMRLVFAATLLVAHWALLSFIPFDGCSGGALLAEYNVVRYLNERYLARYHLAGVISVMPTAALVCGGSLIGDLIRGASGAVMGRVRTLLIIGVASTALGLLWSVHLPMIRAIWTSSFILFAWGLATIALALCHWFVEGKGCRRWVFPFVVFGSNAIAAYFVSIMVRVHTLEEWRVVAGDTSLPLREALWRWPDSHLGEVAGSWAYTGTYLFFWWLVLYWMYRRKWFWKV